MNFWEIKGQEYIDIVFLYLKKETSTTIFIK